MKNAKTINFTICVPEALRDEFMSCCAAQDRGASAVLRRLMREYIAKEAPEGRQEGQEAAQGRQSPQEGLEAAQGAMKGSQAAQGLLSAQEA